MEESFELLSSMSPKVKGLQKTIKVKKVSKLALKKQFRRSLAFDKVRPINNEDLAIVERSTESSESIASTEESLQNKDKNDIVIIDSSDMEEEGISEQKEFLPANLPTDSNYQTTTRIEEWLNGVKEENKCETFFTQASTIIGDDAPNLEKDGDKIAACSSFNDYLPRRFDELFIDKRNDGKTLPKQTKDEDLISDESFSLGIDTSLTSKLEQFNFDKTKQDEPNEKENKQHNINEIILTSDESDQEASLKRSSPKIMSRDMGFVTARKKNDKKFDSECPGTPASQNVEEVASMLDSLYGKKWRRKQDNVLSPMSEPKKKPNNDKISVSNTERKLKPTFKENLMPAIMPNVKRLNFEKLRKPVQSPWIQRLNGLVDSDSESNTEDSNTNTKLEKSKGIEMVKTRLNFDEDSPLEDKLKSKRNINHKTSDKNEKENIPESASKKKPTSSANCSIEENVKKNKKSGSSGSATDVPVDEKYDKKIECLEISQRKSLMSTKNNTGSLSDGKTVPKQNKDEDVTSDGSFSLRIDTSSSSELKQSNSDNSKQDKLNSSEQLNKESNSKKHNVYEILLTSDESDQGASPKTYSSQRMPKGMGFVSARKQNECQGTPASQNIEEVASVLDSLYGKKWRQKHDRVLLPMSEPKKKPNSEMNTVSNTERKVKPTFKENLMPDIRRLNSVKLRRPVQSPWLERLKGLVDSDSESSTGDNNSNDNLEKSKGIEMVKTRLNFDEDSPVEDKLKTKKNINHKTSNKENRPELANNNKNLQKKPTTKTNRSNKENVKKNAKIQSKSSSSSNNYSEDDVSTDEEYDKKIEILEISRRKSMMPTKNKTYSFLESLSACVPINKCDMSARIFRSNFKQHRDELLKKLFNLYNEKVFDKAIPVNSELEWNDKLRKTAGLCYCKRITHRNGNVERKVKIALASKVLDSPDRLRDTLIHEMCHAATWVVNHVSDGHGTYWKSWAFKAMEVFPELPPIKRCHSYEINSKYTYRCTSCGYSFGRHSKSLDTERKRCGICYGKFEVLLNKTSKKGETKSVPVTPRKEATGFALFVKQNYAQYKVPTKKHGEILKILGQKFAELKVKSTS